MHADLLDAALLVIAVAFAISGYRQGFIVGSLSFVGFVGGAALGAQYGPDIARALASGQNRQTQQDIVSVVALFVLALIGQFVFSAIGQYLRQQMRGHSSTAVDAVGGAAVSVLSMLLIAWALGSALHGSTFSGIASQINNSAVLTTMDRVMPSTAENLFSSFRRQLANGPAAEVFGQIGGERLFEVAAPDAGVLNSPGYLAAKGSVVKVQGTALSCGENIEGSGFAFSPDHIMTNAHVVAGVDSQQRVTTESGRTLSAKVVLFDPQVDIAVLYVPGLDLTPLKFDTSGTAGDSAVVAGFPENAPALVQRPARIAGTQDAVGPDIYQTGQVSREIFQVRAVVQEGNSGGPLISPSGTVYGVTFAAATTNSDIGFSLTASEVANDARYGAGSRAPVSTETCDN